ncbi:hypothetical protein [Methylibium petroleiphilum]|uniref:hypothetical protein n=1 Tax=Methylibium petroleiphilum TaxID=105560 RepID=UPI003D2D3059
MHLRIRSIRWLLTAALLACLYFAAHGLQLLYFMKDIGGVSVFQPSTAETVSRDAALFQLNTKETDGLFRIVQRQHGDLNLMFSRLQTADELNWSLMVVGTAACCALTLVIGICLALLPTTGKAEPARVQQNSPSE